ncbi:MAG: hypothetical protein KIT58_01360 [Planctomycetota bacterium]|nr:hypothetical protein [Planctomycetota bacterium]
MVGTPLTIVPVSEDGSKRTHDTWAHLVRRLARAVEPACSTAPSLLRVEAPTTSLRTSARGSGLRRRQPSEVVVGELATLLQQGKFVLVHIDGDTVWSQRTTSTAVEHFEQRVAEPVRKRLVAAIQLQSRQGGPHRRRQRPTASPAPEASAADAAAQAAAAALERLRLVSPYYSVEAWLYQATERAIALAKTHHDGADVETFQAWARERGAVDEVHGLPDTVCLGRQHNAELAAGLTAAVVDDVVGAGKSLAACVDHLRRCAPLVAALRATSAAASEE